MATRSFPARINDSRQISILNTLLASSVAGCLRLGAIRPRQTPGVSGCDKYSLQVQTTVNF